MRFVDGNDGQVYTLHDIHRDWQAFHKEDPDNHAESFRIEMLEILMATINGRNDLKIVGLTPREVSKYITTLRTRIWKEKRWN